MLLEGINKAGADVGQADHRFGTSTRAEIFAAKLLANTDATQKFYSGIGPVDRAEIGVTWIL